MANKPKRNAKEMSATAFKRWLKHMEFNNRAAALALDASHTSIIKWKEVGASRTVKLACAYLASMKEEQP